MRSVAVVADAPPAASRAVSEREGREKPRFPPTDDGSMHEDESHPDRGHAARSAFSDDPEMRALLAFFLEDLDRRIGSLRRALDASDVAGLRSLAHQLSGTAGGYGFPAIGDAAREVESGLPARARRASARADGAVPSIAPSIAPSSAPSSAPSTALRFENDALRELADEAALAAVSERAETLIALCQDAVRAGRREGFAWGLTGELAPGDDDAEADADGASHDDDPFGFRHDGHADDDTRDHHDGDAPR